MLRPSMPEIIGNEGNSYSFVVAVAKRAREISNAINESDELVDEKPVKIAIDEFAKGDCKYIEK